MKMNDILDDRVIDLNAHATDKDDILTQLSGKLQKAGYIDNAEEFKKDIYLREAEGCTGIGSYIAIPHGKSDSVTNVGIAIAKLDEEIEWETLDGKGVKLVFLFAVSNDTAYARNHMLLLADIARKLGNDEAVESMLMAKTIDDLRAVFG
ncbi:fructose PTS transporter subunit IIA [uncultured Faecalibaculum sp.]|uniref:fructose PTS transporter subunit IIA n=1 Tax=uncultured Faecalibaculum sp. TaxID=1729681 RepID=UPI0025D67A8D|nr:fructose PTS transporter subunit IIA [uncultured Faecalibaculum sp.]